MKHLFYSCIAACVLLFAGCADQDVPEIESNNLAQPGLIVSMSLEGNMQGEKTTANTPTSRAIGYETDDNTGFPTPVGIFDKGTNEGKELADGAKVPVLLIFRSTDETQPVTKVITQWTYKKGGNITLLPSEKFEMEANTDLSKGTWFVCGILGGEMLPGNNQVKFNGFSEGHVARNAAGEKVKWGANIPYIFSWRKLETNAANKTFKAEKPVKLKQFGSIVRLKVTNNTDFDFKYNGVRIITSNILCGQFDLKTFDTDGLVKVSDLKDTEDSDIASAKSASFKKAFEAFKFYQRPLTDNAMIGENGLMKKRRFRIHGEYIKDYTEEKDNANKLNTALTYYDHTFLPRASGDNFDKVEKGKEAPSYIYVWMAPQQQAIKIYDGKKEGAGSYTVKKVSKTQFLLMAVPTETSSGSQIVPTSINMLPAYGTLADYVSGANYPAKGKVVYKFAPLSYVAKHDNFGTAAELSSDVNQDVDHSIRYKYSEVEAKLSSIPSGFMFANHEYWRSIVPQGYGFSGFRDNGTYYNHSMGIVSPVKMPGWTSSKLAFHNSSKGVKVGEKLIAYMIGMSKKPDYISDDGEGQAYQGYAKQPATRVSSGITEPLSWITNNDYRYVMRWEDVNNNAVITQRYLGPRFVLDMDDIANEDFWADPNNNNVVYPADVKRIIPLGGGYTFSIAKSKSTGKKLQYWHLSSQGFSAQYWTPDDALPTGRYAMRNPATHNGYILDREKNPPKQAVGFRMPGLSSDTSSFFYYLFRGVSGSQHISKDDITDAGGGEYIQNLIMAAPVRLWKTTPYAD